MQAKPECRLDHDAGRTERSEFRHCPGTLSIKRRSRFTALTRQHCNRPAAGLPQKAHRPPHRGNRDAQRRSEISSVGLRIRLVAAETWATFLLLTFCPLRSLGFSNTPMDQKGSSVLSETNFLVLRHSRECRVSHKVHLGASFASVSGASRRSGSPTQVRRSVGGHPSLCRNLLAKAMLATAVVLSPPIQQPESSHSSVSTHRESA